MSLKMIGLYVKCIPNEDQLEVKFYGFLVGENFKMLPKIFID